MPQTHWIDTPAALTAAIARWAGRDWLTVDTEFLRIDTYRPKLCLVQVGDGQDAWVIDAIAIADLGPLFARLADPATVKVFHAAAQDLEIFAQLTGGCPAPVFDTQLAAALLGLGDQLGYAGLAEKRLGVSIDKSLSRTDWSKRPLRQAEIDYAAADVVHLATLYPPLRAELVARGREAWLLEDARRMVDPATYETRPDDAYKRLRGLAGHLALYELVKPRLERVHDQSFAQACYRRQAKFGLVRAYVDRLDELDNVLLCRSNFRKKEMELRQKVGWRLGHGRAGHHQLAYRKMREA